LVPSGVYAVELDGLIEPYMVVNVGSGVAGILETVKVDRGDVVKKGQILAALQSGVEKATLELARARARLEASIKAKQANLHFCLRKQSQTKELYEKGAIPFDEMDKAETNRTLAEMELQEALDNKRLAKLELKRATEVVKRLTIRSPINGVVVERFMHPGEYVEDRPILKLAQIDPLNVEIIAPVSLYGSIKKGIRAAVRPEAPMSSLYTAEVKIVDTVIDAASGTFGVRLELPNPDHHLPAGLKCSVVFPEQ
jgi:RND family efflux transporter MFP subunit